MSPPIRDGSGSSIGSIRLGDGSEIAEVRTGAGDVLFSASIPDSGLNHLYLSTDVNAPDGETGVDWQPNSETSSSPTLTANGDVEFSSDQVNGNPAFVYNDGGTTDYHIGQFASAVSRPDDMFIVAKFRSISAGSAEYLASGFSNNSHAVFEDTNGDWQIYGGSTVGDGGSDDAVDTSWHLITVRWDDSGNSEIRIDQTTIETGDSGNNLLDGFSLAIDGGQSGSTAPVNIAAVGSWSTDVSGYSLSDVEQFFVNRFGPFPA